MASRQNELITFRLPQELAAAVRRIADRDSENRSTALRLLIRRGLEHEQRRGHQSGRGGVMTSPWLSLTEAAQYTKRGRRFIAKEVKAWHEWQRSTRRSNSPSSGVKGDERGTTRRRGGGDSGRHA